MEEQSGNYLALKFDATPANAVTTVEIVGGKKGAVTLNPDMLFVGRITDTTKQKIKVVSALGEKIATKTYALTGLTLETAET